MPTTSLLPRLRQRLVALRDHLSSRPRNREKPLGRLIRVAVERADQLCVLLLAVGLLGLLLLPVAERRVKVDEKALMLGSAAATLRGNKAALEHGLRLAHEVHAQQYGASQSLVESIRRHMELAGMETGVSAVHSAPFPQHDPTLGDGNQTAGQGSTGCWTVHGVLRAPQTDGTEGLLLVTPVALTPGDGPGGVGRYWDAPAPGAPLLLGAGASLASHLRSVSWLSRDVVWVVPDARCGATTSLSAWARHYHGWGDGGWGGDVADDELSPSAGVLQQALVLQADRVDVNSAQILVEGFDGQLPKLDSYNALKQLLWAMPGVRLLPPAGSTNIGWLVKATAQWQIPGAATYLSKLGTLLAFMWRQALGLPTGPHAALKAYLIDAATARFSAHAEDGSRMVGPTDPPTLTPASGAGTLPSLHPHLASKVVNLGEYAELIVRSFNNLDERFHHSFFMYLLTSADRFVAIEVYIAPLVCLILAILLKAAKQRHALRAAREAAVKQPGPLAAHGALPTLEELGNPSLWPAAVVVGGACALASAAVGWGIRRLACHTCMTCLDDACCAFASGAGGPGSLIWKQLAGLPLGMRAAWWSCVAAAAACLAFELWRVVADVAVPRPAPYLLNSGKQELKGAVRAVLLCGAGVRLAAMASTNWALAYVVAAALATACVLSGAPVAPLSDAAAAVVPDTGAASSRASWQDRLPALGLAVVRVRVLQLTSPLMLLVMVAGSRLEGTLGAFQDTAMGEQGCSWPEAATAHSITAWVHCATMAVISRARLAICCTWPSMYHFCWSVLMPVWVMEALRMLRAMAMSAAAPRPPPPRDAVQSIRAPGM